MGQFTQKDVEEHRALDRLISESARWNLTTAQSVQLYRSLVWYAQLREKIEANLFEITKVTENVAGESEE